MEFLDFEQLYEGEWKPCVFDELQAGDVFRAVDEPEQAFVALGEPYPAPGPDGIDRGNKGIKIKRISATTVKSLARIVAPVKIPWWRRLYQWSIA